MAIHTDRQRLEQILKNLLSNAVKFTDAGRVSLTVSATADGWVQFTVQDSGIGIAPDQQDKIFDAFHQADGSTNRKYGGTGLGLSISRDLTNLLGGTLTLASTPGEGSTFTLSLPRNGAVGRDPAGAPAGACGAAGAYRRCAGAGRSTGGQPAGPRFEDDRAEPADGRRTALVIEDEPEFARILYGLAHDMEFRCLVALTAGEGLELAGAEKPGRDPARHAPAGPLRPVGAAAAEGQPGHPPHSGARGVEPGKRRRSPAPGRDRLCAETHHPRAAGSRVPQAQGKISQKVKRVLLVEDDERQRESVVKLISDSDVEIAAVGSGEEALALLRTQIFDCMIIDLKLPDMQGNELLKRMSLEELCSFPPVIVYTGRNLTREEEAELLKYSRSIIIKGARSPERLLDEVTLFLHKVESQLSTERQTMLKNVRGRDRVFEGRTILLVDDDVRNVFA
jgi:CheY-like chemotaxis protein